jgi:hypothetical protein
MPKTILEQKKEEILNKKDKLKGEKKLLSVARSRSRDDQGLR